MYIIASPQRPDEHQTNTEASSEMFYLSKHLRRVEFSLIPGQHDLKMKAEFAAYPQGQVKVSCSFATVLDLT
jgi:hypothetical protein